MSTPNRKMISIKLPPELIEELQKEAELRGATLTAVIEERLTRRKPLHKRLDRIEKLLKARYRN